VKLFLAAMFFVFSSASADSATQNDWSGGPGILGPVTSWGDSFYSEATMFWQESGLEIAYEDIYIGSADWGFSVATSDIDGDGHNDVIAASRMADQVVWWRNADGLGTTWIEQTVGYAPGVVSVDPKDIDGDGDPDIVAACGEANDLSWWKSHVTPIGVSWTKHAIDASYYGAADVVAEDIDGDGDIDVVSTNWTYHSASWWGNLNGTGASWTEHIIDTGILGPRDLQVGDIDNDGDQDAVVVTSENDLIVWWENTDGIGSTWTEHVLTNHFEGWGVCITDVDGDADNDIVVCSSLPSPGSVIWLENTGDGSSPCIAWIEHIVDSDTSELTSVVADDVDNDGDQDLISGGFGNCTAWWENQNGIGSEWKKHYILHYGGWSLCASDVDGDQFTDLIGGYPNNVSLWELMYPSSSSLESSVLYLGNDPGWGSLDWDATITTNNSRVCFQLRASDNPSQMGPWSDTLFTPCDLGTILNPNDSYFQYRAILQTADPFASPVLNSITINWNALGIEDPGARRPGATSLLPIVPCPVSGALIVQFQLACDCSAEFSIYDLGGRLMDEARGEFGVGQGMVVFSDFQPGVYFVRMAAGDYSATERFVVVE
jgi:hypothetical protein